MDKKVILLALLDQHVRALGTSSKTERNVSSSMLLSVSLVALPKRISLAPPSRSPHTEVLRIHHHLPVISVRLIESLLLLHKLCPITNQTFNSPNLHKYLREGKKSGSVSYVRHSPRFISLSEAYI